jgi:2-(1,2-epoxy-1,2-dihydrophenyl)acetyl-CoA isomerase
MSPEILLSNQEAGVLTLTLNHPKVNAFDNDLIHQLHSALKRAANDDQVRCVILTGAGGHFSAGQDLNAFESIGPEPYRRHLLDTFNLLILQIRRLAKPILAAINGPVSGAALGLVLACDLRIAGEGAQFFVGFTRLGLSCDSAVSLLLPALIGLGRATEFTYSNAPINTNQALAWGLVNRVAPDEELEEQAAAWAQELALGPIHAMGLAKRAFNKAVLGNLETVLDYEAHLQEIAGQGAEHQEGIKAFLEKRAPNFTAI